jgi:hypothetical protein
MNPTLTGAVLVVAAFGWAGCASSVPSLPMPQSAFVANPAADPASPRVVWIREWRMYLREGDAVLYGGRYYAYRDGRWYTSDAERGPWVLVDPRRTTASRPPAPAGGEPSPGAASIVSEALRHVGTPYEWGGEDTDGFDCSGLVKYVYGRRGLALPHNVGAQYRLGQPVSRDDLEPGDVVFFDRLRHNGIYIGNGKFVHATKTGDVVKVSSLDESWYRRRWVGARRLL